MAEAHRPDQITWPAGVGEDDVGVVFLRVGHLQLKGCILGKGLRGTYDAAAVLIK